MNSPAPLTCFTEMYFNIILLNNTYVSFIWPLLKIRHSTLLSAVTRPYSQHCVSSEDNKMLLARRSLFSYVFFHLGLNISSSVVFCFQDICNLWSCVALRHVSHANKNRWICLNLVVRKSRPEHPFCTVRRQKKWIWRSIWWLYKNRIETSSLVFCYNFSGMHVTVTVCLLFFNNNNNYYYYYLAI